MSQFDSLSEELQDRVAKIRALTIDVDGVLTDGRIIYDQDGHNYQSFDIHDGYGIKAIQRLGIEIAIISGRASQAVQRRASELGIENVYQASADKTVALNDFCTRKCLSTEQVAHIGDDVPDICLFEIVGVAVCVPNGTEIARRSADFVTAKSGGEGAVREVCDLLLEANTR
ncbi:MAG: HAD hydrolase family protein [Gammaproteobacteria bacterium]|nr:HAD hydrolase family protein [Gammaproteobacteria bacterium]MYD80402.1 HAD hydrolase family protein [Gammaproteobacteria bacterium]